MQNLNKLYNLIVSAPDDFNASLPAVEKNIYAEVEKLVDNLERSSSGAILQNEKNINSISKLKKKIEKIVLSKEYVFNLKKYLGAYNDVVNFQNKYFSNYNFQPKKYHENLQKLAIANTADTLTESGVRASVVRDIYDTIFRGATVGENYKKLTENLKQKIISTPKIDGAMLRHARTYVVDSIATFSAQYMAEISADIDVEWYMYTGAIKTTSRCFCERMKEKKYIHVSEFSEVLRGKINGKTCEICDRTGLPQGLKAGTNYQNLVVYRGGWGCQHQLEPIPKAVENAIVPAFLLAKFKK